MGCFVMVLIRQCHCLFGVILSASEGSAFFERVNAKRILRRCAPQNDMGVSIEPGPSSYAMRALVWCHPEQTAKNLLF
jgi:hypothetical protein